MKPEAYEHVIMFLQRYEQATGLEGLNKHTASSLLQQKSCFISTYS